MKIYFPTVLSYSVLHWASTTSELNLSFHFEDSIAELKREGQSFAICLGLSTWRSSGTAVIQLQFYLSNSLGWHFNSKSPGRTLFFFLLMATFVSAKLAHTRSIHCQYLSASRWNQSLFPWHFVLASRKCLRAVRCTRNLRLRASKSRTCLHTQWKSPSSTDGAPTQQGLFTLQTKL